MLDAGRAVDATNPATPVLIPAYRRGDVDPAPAGRPLRFSGEPDAGRTLLGARDRTGAVLPRLR